jgi:hypothetical protein
MSRKITLNQMLTNKRPIGLSVDEFNLIDAEHIASITDRERRLRALNDLHPDRQPHVKKLVIELFEARRRNA